MDQQIPMILFIVILTINFAIYLPIGAYFTWKFWTLRNNIFIAKRRPLLVLISIIFIYAWLLGARTIDVYDVVYQIEGNKYVLVLITDTGWLCVNAVVVRMWLLYFDYKRANHLSSLRWKMKIDSTTTPWTLKHKYLSNLKYLMLVCLIQWLLLQVVEIIGISIKNNGVRDASQLTFMICFLIPMLIIAIKVRKFSDDYYIKMEMKLVLLWFIIFCVIFVGVVIPFLTMGSVTRVCTMAYLTCFVAFGCVLTWTAYPIYQLQKRNKLLQLQNSHNKCMSFTRFLSYRDGFESFAEQLIREFSLENLLFLLEMTQIKKQILNIGLLDNTQIGFMLDFNNKVMHVKRQQTSIQNISDCLKNIGYIVDNYISDFGDYSINISSAIRNKILSAKDAMGNDGKTTMFLLSTTNHKSLEMKLQKVQSLSSIQMEDTNIEQKNE
eukprot:168071_1